MWLVNRDSDGTGQRRIPLPAPLREALVRWYVGKGTRRDEEAGIMLVQQARIGAKWIACDCLAEGDAPPILTPAFLSGAETYYLRRLTSARRPEHRPDCPFFRDQVTARLSEVRSPDGSADPAPGYFEVLRPAPEKLAQRPDGDPVDDRTRQASVPRLARLLWRLLDLSGVGRIESALGEIPSPSIKSEFDALSRAAARVEIAPGIELGRAFWTHAQALHSRRAYAQLRGMAKSWPRGHAPQGFFALFSPHFQGHEIVVPGSGPVVVANRVQSPSLRDNPIKGPYLVLVVVGEYPEAHGYAPLRAYAQPIYSGQRFVPVGSERERMALRQVFSAQWLLASAGVELFVERPVFDQLTPLGACRPDLLVEARSLETGEVREIVVDYRFGEDEEAGGAAARRDRLGQFGSVLEIGAEDLEREVVAAKLCDALGFDGLRPSAASSRKR
jgi:hypothetical protein